MKGQELTDALKASLAEPAFTPGRRISDWVKCIERMPENGQLVICIGYNFQQPARGFWVRPVVAKYAEDEFWPADETEMGVEDAWCGDVPVYADFWMPLPDSPEGCA